MRSQIFTIVWWSRISLTLIILACFVVVLFLPFLGLVKAKEWGRAYVLINFDLQNEQKISNKSRKFKIKIPADLVVDDEISVRVKKISKSKYQIPNGYKAISNVYRYSFDNSLNNFVLNDELKLFLKYNSNSKNKKAIFYWDSDENKWLELKSKIGKKSKTSNFIIAKTDFEELDVVVLERIRAKNFEPVRKKDIIDPAIYSLAGVLMDVKSGKIMFCDDCNQKLTLASMTKIITADVVMDLNIDFKKIYTYQYWDDADGVSVWLSAGDRVKVNDLFYTSLVKSANNATKALAHSTGLSDAAFAVKMNERAKQVGANSCSFYEPTGLDWRNACSSSDYAKIAIDALKKYKILQATTTKSYGYNTLGGKWISVNNTNLLLNRNLYILGGKTGYLPEIGMNLMTKARDRAGHELIAVVIGGSSYYGAADDVERLLRWGMTNWMWDVGN